MPGQGTVSSMALEWKAGSLLHLPPFPLFFLSQNCKRANSRAGDDTQWCSPVGSNWFTRDICVHLFLAHGSGISYSQLEICQVWPQANTIRHVSSPQLVYKRSVAYAHLETPSYSLSQSTGAAKTKCHRLGGL